jgi:hypothetical protein
MIGIHFNYSVTLILEKIKSQIQQLSVDLGSIVMNINSMKRFSRLSTENLKKNESFVRRELLWMQLLLQRLEVQKTNPNLVILKCIVLKSEITTIFEQKLILQ